MTRGDVVRVRGLRGTFRVTGEGGDGSLTLYGGPKGYECFRSVTVDRVRKTREPGPERHPEMAAPTRRNLR